MSSTPDRDAGGPCLVRRLGADDAAAYQSMRLHGLRMHPEALASSAEQEADKPLDWSRRRRLAPDAARPHDFFLGAFRGDDLCGVTVPQAAAIPISVLFLIGVRLARRIVPRLFYRRLYLGMFLTGVKRLWAALA